MHTRLLAVLFMVSVPSANAQNIEACRLLPKADVASALGRPAPEGQKDAGKMGEITFTHCSYMDGDKTLVLATIYTYQVGKAEMKQQFEAAKKQAGAGDAETVSGLGDDAYWWKSKTTLLVIKDKYMVSVLMGPSVGKLEAAKAMAAKIVQGLPRA
jgi:hypothetical protein